MSLNQVKCNTQQTMKVIFPSMENEFQLGINSLMFIKSIIANEQAQWSTKTFTCYLSKLDESFRNNCTLY